MALLVIISCTSLVMAAGLTKGSDGKWHYVLSNGNYAKNTWMTVSGSKYYFDGNGNGVTGFYTVSGKKYYFERQMLSLKSIPRSKRPMHKSIPRLKRPTWDLKSILRSKALRDK